jgi:hypothetical protein
VSTGLFTAEDARVKLKRLPSMILGIDDKKHWHSVLSAQLLSNRQSHQGAGKELETPLAWIEKVSPVILFTRELPRPEGRGFLLHRTCLEKDLRDLHRR